MGRPRRPVWQQAFWYRGSAIPGAAQLRVDRRPHQRPARPAGRLREPRPACDRATRSSCTTSATASTCSFAVTDGKSYPIEQTTDPAVLTRDLRRRTGGRERGRSRRRTVASYLTLVTCDGTFRNGTHDHRLVVHADRIF